MKNRGLKGEKMRVKIYLEDATIADLFRALGLKFENDIPDYIPSIVEHVTVDSKITDNKIVYTFSDNSSLVFIDGSIQ